MKRKVILSSVIGIAATLIVGCGGVNGATSTETETKIVRVAFNQSESHPEYIAMKEFGEKFEEATDGAYKVEIYPNAVLGDQGAVTEFVRTGALDMAMVPCSVPEGYNADFGIMGAPYLYNDMEHMEKAILSGVFDDLFKSTKHNNFEVVAAYNAGVRNIYTDKPINTPEDLKGYKIRVMDSNTYIEMLNLMGGIGTPMAQGDVYTAVQQKVIEGGENSERVFVDFKHYEISKYYSYTKHIILPDVVVANEGFLNSMTSEHREAFDKLMRESIEKEFELFAKSAEEGKKEAEKNGTVFIYPDVELFREKCKPILDRLSNQSETTRKIYNDIQALK